MGEFLQVKRKRGRANAQPLGDLAGGHTAWALFHEQAKDREASLLGQGGEEWDSSYCFHISTIMEINEASKGHR